MSASAPPASGASALRVAYLASRYPAVTHTFIAEEVRALREAGVEIHTFSIRRPAPEDVLGARDRRELAGTQWLLPAGPGVVARAHLRAFARAPGAYLSTLARALRRHPPGLRALVWQVFYFAEAMMLWSHLERRGLRHVHVHFPNVSSDVALLATRYANAAGRDDRRWTWSMTLHGPTEFFDAGAHGLAGKVADAAAVICISDFTRSQVMACSEPSSWDRLHVVPCGVDVAAFAPAARAQENPRAERLNVLNVAALSARKGHATMLEAIALLRRRGVEVAATVIGDGPERESLSDGARRLGVADVTRFRGAVGHEQVREAYAAADVFCLPSFAEGVPIVLMEAMASGVPVVASAINGIPELVRDGQTGLLVPPARADLLADALQALVEDEALRARLAAQAREHVIATHELHACARQLLGVLAGAVGAASAATAAQQPVETAARQLPGDAARQSPGTAARRR